MIFLFLLASMPVLSQAQESESKLSDNRVTEKLRSILNSAGGDSEFLDADEAFRLSLATQSDQFIIGRFRIANGYYL